MQRTTTLFTVFILVTAGGAAQTPTETDPGFITADSPLYGLDVAFDEVVKPPGAVAHERASEALVAAEANMTDARDRALHALNRTVRRANGVEHVDGLDNAAQVLTELQDQVPENAQPGIDTALENIAKAKQRFPTDPVPNDTGRPDSQERGV